MGPQEVPCQVPCHEDDGASLEAEAGVAQGLDLVAGLPRPLLVYQVTAHEVHTAGSERAVGGHLEGQKHPHGLPCRLLLLPSAQQASGDDLLGESPRLCDSAHPPGLCHAVPFVLPVVLLLGLEQH